MIVDENYKLAYYEQLLKEGWSEREAQAMAFESELTGEELD